MLLCAYLQVGHRLVALVQQSACMPLVSGKLCRARLQQCALTLTVLGALCVDRVVYLVHCRQRQASALSAGQHSSRRAAATCQCGVCGSGRRPTTLCPARKQL